VKELQARLSKPLNYLFHSRNWVWMLTRGREADLEHRFNNSSNRGAPEPTSSVGSRPFFSPAPDAQLIGSGMFEQLPSQDLVDQLYGNGGLGIGSFHC
jgi:hypothetical protein